MKNDDKTHIEIGKAVLNALKNLEEKECIQIYRHLPDLEIECRFSNDKKYRYCLCVEKKDVEEGDIVCVIMQNPSYANEYIADKSVNFLEKALFKYEVPVENVKRMVVVNLFAKIQTDDFEHVNTPEENENIKFIRKAIDESDVVIIGWGSKKEFIKKKKEVVELLINYSGTVYKTKKHPSLHPESNKKEVKKFIKIWKEKERNKFLKNLK